MKAAWTALLRTALTGKDEPWPVSKWRTRFVYASYAAAFLLGLSAQKFVADMPDYPRHEMSVVIAFCSVFPLAFVLTRPLVAWRLAWWFALLMAPMNAVGSQMPWPWNPVQIIVLLVVLFGVAFRHEAGVVAWIGGLTGLLVLVFVDSGNIGGVLLVVAVLLVLGHQIGLRVRAQRKLAVEEERSELEHARRAVLEERTRIARELHDVVAHHLSLITIRAQSAPYRLPGMQDDTKAEFGELENAAREALTEMRRLLGVLRNSEDQGQRAPQPGLDRLDDLLGTARDAGVQIDSYVNLAEAGGPERRALPAGVSLTGYRIVQEALSNASRHAPGQPVRLAVTATAGAVTILVQNRLLDDGAGSTGASGHGLVGMRERVAMLGGELTAQPEDGHWLVRADLPTQGQQAELGE
ncbi:sensor histidine kinase [Longispora albida]|uniref:sensor histidine kinase n=1 Tax=Longispora albida TaxID=203523 RepID=UPI00037FD39B|nr:histidine kinase [Longispora albida]